MRRKVMLLVVIGLVASFMFSSIAFAFGPGSGGFLRGGNVDDSAPAGPGGFGRGMMGGYGQHSENSMMTILGEVLEMDWNELREAHWEGKSWAEIAAERGVSREELSKAIVKVRSDYLQQLVDEGAITEEYKEQAIAYYEERIDYMLDAARSTGPRGGRGGCCGGGDIRGGGEFTRGGGAFQRTVW